MISVMIPKHMRIIEDINNNEVNNGRGVSINEIPFTNFKYSAYEAVKSDKRKSIILNFPKK